MKNSENNRYVKRTQKDYSLSFKLQLVEEITELLEYTPSKIYVRKIIRPKYALPNDVGIAIAELPSRILAKSNVGAGLLAWIIVSK